MTFLLVFLLVVLIIAVGGLVTLGRRSRIGREHPLASNTHTLGMLGDLVRQGPGKPSRWPGSNWRGGYRDLVPRQPDGESNAVQHMPGRGITATLADEEGPDTVLGYEPSLVPVRNATAEQPLGLFVTALSSAAYLPQLDVYYVQRNVIALARSLRPAGIDQRAAALTLSAVMSSRLGHINDVREALQESVESANRVVRSISSRDPEYSDMVTTLDIAVLTSDARQSVLHFAHIGNSSIWLLRAGNRTVHILSESHTVENGTLLRAVGLSQEVLPDIDKVAVRPGDRVFLTSASSGFSFTSQAMEAVLAYAAEPLQGCAAALADAARASGVQESITIVAAEVSQGAMFSG